MKPYVPEPLPIEGIDHDRLLPLLDRAYKSLSSYNMVLRSNFYVGNILSCIKYEEAVYSSRIESVLGKIQDVLKYDAVFYDDRKGLEEYEDLHEISNCYEALFLGETLIGRKGRESIDLHFVRTLHSILLDSKQGRNKKPGEVRTEQNFIGRPGSTLETATFIPPDPVVLPEYLERWVEYINSDQSDVLIQCAVLHAYFEILHPFLDGNGRIGRVLIPLFLYMKKELEEPVFSLSAFIYKHREEYYQRLRGIQEKGDWQGWIEFFLDGIHSQSVSDKHKAHLIITKSLNVAGRVREYTKTKYSDVLFSELFRRPIFKVSKFVSMSEVYNKIYIYKFINDLKDMGILNELRASKSKGSAILCFDELLQIISEEEDF